LLSLRFLSFIEQDEPCTSPAAVVIAFPVIVPTFIATDFQGRLFDL